MKTASATLAVLFSAVFILGRQTAPDEPPAHV